MVICTNWHLLDLQYNQYNLLLNNVLLNNICQNILTDSDEALLGSTIISSNIDNYLKDAMHIWAANATITTK